MIADYLSAGSAVIARIQARIPTLTVGAAVDLAGQIEPSDTLPAVHVQPFKDRLGESAGRGQAQVVSQIWLVVLAVKNSRAASGTMAEAGPLLSSLLSALQGWTPAADFAPLARVEGPETVITPAVAYFPLAFEARLTTITSNL